ncbi:hypothetical protein SUGI_0007720 [Cryptomeria japonica]|nr:hypothetical protein SUGI_0007720 [Cryptomeria japonica]
MAEEKQRQRELRVVMFPWLAYGHMTPFLELAKTLTTHGLKIFFVSIPLNIQRIKLQMFESSFYKCFSHPLLEFNHGKVEVCGASHSSFNAI